MNHIPLWMNILLIVLAAAAGMLSARRFAMRQPDADIASIHKHTRRFHLLTVVLILSFIVAVALRTKPNLIWSFPLGLQYVIVPAVWGLAAGIVVYVFTFACFLMRSARHPETRTMAVATVLLIAAMEVAYWQYTRPAAPDLSHKTSLAGAILQTSDVSCCAASAANILRLYGMDVTEREMAERFETGKYTGTSAAQVVFGLRKMGVSCRTVTAETIDTIRPPAMLFVDDEQAGPEAHAIAYLRQDGARFFIIDPLTGEERVSAEKIERIWHGKAVEVAGPVAAKPGTNG